MKLYPCYEPKGGRRIKEERRNSSCCANIILHGQTSDYAPHIKLTDFDLASFLASNIETAGMTSDVGT